MIINNITKLIDIFTTYRPRFFSKDMIPVIMGIYKDSIFLNPRKFLVPVFKIRKFMKNMNIDNDNLLIVCTNPDTREYIYEFCEIRGLNFIHEKWKGGYLTNFKNNNYAVRRLKEIESLTNMYEYPLDDHLELLREYAFIRAFLAGRKHMQFLPKIVFFVNGNVDLKAVEECNKLNIPTVIFSNNKELHSQFTYVIPFNIKSSPLLHIVLSCLVKNKNVLGKTRKTIRFK